MYGQIYIDVSSNIYRCISMLYPGIYSDNNIYLS